VAKACNTASFQPRQFIFENSSIRKNPYQWGLTHNELRTTFGKIEVMDTPLSILFLIIIICGTLSGSVGYVCRCRSHRGMSALIMKIFCGVFFSAVTVLLYEFILGGTFMTEQQNLKFYMLIGLACLVTSAVAFLSAGNIIDRLINPQD
jgi:hypothetical protein